MFDYKSINITKLVNYLNKNIYKFIGDGDFDVVEFKNNSNRIDMHFYFKNDNFYIITLPENFIFNKNIQKVFDEYFENEYNLIRILI